MTPLPSTHKLSTLILMLNLLFGNKNSKKLEKSKKKKYVLYIPKVAQNFFL